MRFRFFWFLKNTHIFDVYVKVNSNYILSIINFRVMAIGLNEIRNIPFLSWLAFINFYNYTSQNFLQINTLSLLPLIVLASNNYKNQQQHLRRRAKRELSYSFSQMTIVFWCSYSCVFSVVDPPLNHYLSVHVVYLANDSSKHLCFVSDSDILIDGIV